MRQRDPDLVAAAGGCGDFGREGAGGLHVGYLGGAGRVEGNKSVLSGRRIGVTRPLVVCEQRDRNGREGGCGEARGPTVERDARVARGGLTEVEEAGEVDPCVQELRGAQAGVCYGDYVDRLRSQLSCCTVSAALRKHSAVGAYAPR